MRLLLALRDVKTGRFLAPVTASTPGEAERIYTEILQQPGTIVQKHPRDFPLYQIGLYDDVTGEVFPLVDDHGEAALPRLLLDAGQFLTARADAASDARAELEAREPR